MYKAWYETGISKPAINSKYFQYRPVVFLPQGNLFDTDFRMPIRVNDAEFVKWKTL